MRAVSLTLHNFRTFTHATIGIARYTLLVGANNCGKSNVVDAIRAFYEHGIKFEATRDFPKFATEDNESWIELQYRPSDQELATLKEEYQLPDGTFRVRKYFQSGELDGEGKPKTGIYAYVGGQLSDSRFYGTRNVQQGKLGDVIFVPAVSKLDEHTKLSGPSALRDLVNAVLQRIMRDSPSYRKLTTSFSDFESAVRTEKAPDGRSLSSLEAEIGEEISGWETKPEFFVDPLVPDQILKNLIGLRVRDPRLEQPEDPSCCGQGFQRHLIFSLVKLAASHSSGSGSRPRKDFAPQLTWILFEEPEAFLHPSLIDALSMSLRKISQEEGSQVLITTHNPQFASRSMDELPSLVRLCRTDVRTHADQIDTQTLASIVTANQEDLACWRAAGVGIDQDDQMAEMECIKYALWLNPLRCRAFFANTVLLVEGVTETSLFGHMLDSALVAVPPGGLFILDCMGKWNIHRFMNLLAGLGIAHAVLYDHDNGKPGDVEIAKTIEASRNKHTLGIDRFAASLERFLGIPEARQPHRKPQHLMWQLMQGAIDLNRLASLAKKIESLVGM